MERLKAILKKVFCLPDWLAILVGVPSFVFVFVMLRMENGNPVLTYLSYFLSAYALVTWITGIAGLVSAVRKDGNRLPLLRSAYTSPFAMRLRSDVCFRSELSLYLGLGFNLLYAALKLLLGIWYRSAWFASLAGYYAMLALARFVLLHHVKKVPIGQDVPSEFRRCRVCGIALLLTNQALVGVLVYMVKQNRCFVYPGMLIYAMAAYAFYSVIAAVVKFVKYRKHGSPLLSAAKVIHLTAALVSMLSLETAMLARFGEDDFQFRQVMVASSGGVVCLTILGMAVFMIAWAGRRSKMYRMQLPAQN